MAMLIELGYEAEFQRKIGHHHHHGGHGFNNTSRPAWNHHHHHYGGMDTESERKANYVTSKAVKGNWEKKHLRSGITSKPPSLKPKHKPKSKAKNVGDGGESESGCSIM